MKMKNCDWIPIKDLSMEELERLQKSLLHLSLHDSKIVDTTIIEDKNSTYVFEEYEVIGGPDDGLRFGRARGVTIISAKETSDERKGKKQRNKKKV